jgi:hypothetical protein
MMAGKKCFSVFGKFPFLLLFFLFAVFSCKSAAPPSQSPERAENLNPEIPALETEESPLTETANDAVNDSDDEYVGDTGDGVIDTALEDEGDTDVSPELEEEADFLPEEHTEIPSQEPLPEEDGEELPEQQEIVIEPPESAVQEAEMAPPKEEVIEPPAPEQSPVQEQIPVTPQEPVLPPQPPREPPPPPFLRPTEPELTPAPRQELPVPVNPPPELPSRLPPEPSAEQIVFSRIVRLTVGQIFEIPFRGTGWVYLGELGNRRGISYNSRNLDVEAGSTIGQTFVFIAEAAGTYILKFYKQDFIQDLIINDYVQVIVGEKNEDSGTVHLGRDRVTAEPRWPLLPGSAAVTNAETVSPVTQLPSPEAGTGEAGGRADSEPERTTPERQADKDAAPLILPRADAPFPVESLSEYVRKAKQEFDAGRIDAALAILDIMRQHYPPGTDEAWWLYGQLLEANSSSRDIRLALEYYRRLVNEYPQSNRASDALRRIAYLERYYFNIR